jgi:hypothetical protein
MKNVADGKRMCPFLDAHKGLSYGIFGISTPTRG